MDVGGWLRSLELGRYEQAFRENEIDGEILPRLTSDDLIAIGVTAVGHRRKLLDAIAALRDGSALPPISPVTTQSAADGELRQVAVLFADLAGYTELSNRLHPEEVRSLLDAFFDLVDRIIADHGGTVDKHIGDCVMAVFGAPIAHGNDIERTVRAALTIRDAMPNLAERLGMPAAVHIGVASGQVVAGGTGSAGHLEYTVTGESVNLASRLTDEGRAGEILISDAVRQLLLTRLDCADVGEISAKGFAAPVRAWRLEGIRSSTELATGRPFVGRQGEHQQLRAALSACEVSGHGQTVILRGEAGIGKTRLVEELRQDADMAGFACHSALVLDFGADTGRDTVRALARSLMGLESLADELARRRAAEKAIVEGLLRPDGAVFLNDLLDLPQPRQLRALFDAMDNASRNRGKRETLASLIIEASKRRPLLIVVEDVHWADELTLAHLARMADAVAHCPALLVLTTRIEGDPLDHLWRSRTGGAPTITIDLAPLRREEAMALASASSEVAARHLAAHCVDRAAGNPLFLEQLLRHAVDASDGATVPGSVQSLVQSRLDRLDPADRKALVAASVLGQRFSLPALQHLVGDHSYQPAGLIEHFLIRSKDGGFLFAHALIRDAAYDSLLRARRHELHRAAAQWYAGYDAILRAEHLDRAEDADAAEAFAEAAESEAAILHYERALLLAERGLGLARTAETQLKLAMLKAEYMREVGLPADSIAAFRQALQLAGDDASRCRAWIGVAAGVRLIGGYADGMEALAQAELLACRRSADLDLAQIHYYRGCLLFAAGDVEGCLAQHGQAHEAALRSGNPEWQAWTLSGLGDAHYARGRMRLAMDYFVRCKDLCQQHGFGRAEVGSIHMIGVTRRYLNELREAIHDLESAVTVAATVGNRRTEMVALNILGELLVDCGEFERAYEAIEKSLGIADALGNPRFRMYTLYELGRAFWYDGRRFAEAEESLSEALKLSRDTGMAFLGPRVLAARALVTSSSCLRRDALAEGEAIAGSGCLAHVVLWFYRDAIEASLNAGEWNEAARYAAALHAYTRSEPLPWAEFFVGRGEALATAARGDDTDEVRAELKRLKSVAEQTGLLVAAPAIDAALAPVG